MGNSVENIPKLWILKHCKNTAWIDICIPFEYIYSIVPNNAMWDGASQVKTTRLQN